MYKSFAHFIFSLISRPTLSLTYVHLKTILYSHQKIPQVFSTNHSIAFLFVMRIILLLCFKQFNIFHMLTCLYSSVSANIADWYVPSLYTFYCFSYNCNSISLHYTRSSYIPSRTPSKLFSMLPFSIKMCWALKNHILIFIFYLIPYSFAYNPLQFH